MSTGAPLTHTTKSAAIIRQAVAAQPLPELRPIAVLCRHRCSLIIAYVSSDDCKRANDDANDEPHDSLTFIAHGLPVMTAQWAAVDIFIPRSGTLPH